MCCYSGKISLYAWKMMDTLWFGPRRLSKLIINFITAEVDHLRIETTACVTSDKCCMLVLQHTPRREARMCVLCTSATRD
jgi:hypothetical protein